MARSEPSCLIRHPEGFYMSEVPAAPGRPLRTFLPTGYEPNYPYPLVVFFHGHGGNDEQILRLAPRLSRRNFVSIALRGPHAVTGRTREQGSFSWSAEQPIETSVEDYVLGSIDQTRRAYHIHSERIYLAGHGDGATLAYRLALAWPEKFAGVVSMNGLMPRRGGPLFRLAEIRHLKVLIAHGLANSLVPLSLARSDHRLLYSAGVDVRLNTYPTTHRIHADMLRDINRWIIGHINDELDALRYL